MLPSLRIYIDCNYKHFEHIKTTPGIDCYTEWIVEIKACLEQLSNFYIASSILVEGNSSELPLFRQLGCIQGANRRFQIDGYASYYAEWDAFGILAIEFCCSQQGRMRVRLDMDYLSFLIYDLGPVKEWYGGTWDVIDGSTQIFG